MTKTALFALMSVHKSHVATLKFYDMADRYILRIGDWHQDLSDTAANSLLDELVAVETVTIITENNRRTAKIKAF